MMLLPLLIMVLVILIVVLIGAIYLVIAVFTGAPFVTVNSRELTNIIKAARLKPGQTLIDLGSGEGKILLAAMSNDLHAIGYEINPLLCALTWLRIQVHPQRKFGKIYWRNFWRQNLSNADAIVVYGIPHIMTRLQKKLAAECKVGTRILSCGFALPEWHEQQKIGTVRVYIL